MKLNKTIPILLLTPLGLWTPAVSAQQITTANTAISCGQVTFRQPIKAEFTLKNSGTQPLIIKDVRSSCGCTTVEYDKEPIASGQTFKVSAVYDAKQMGHFQKQLGIYSNASDEPFMLTYGDGVADINIDDLVKFHKDNGHIATLTAVNIGQRFGVLDIEKDNKISSFREKSDNDGGRINAGFMVLEPKIFDFIDGDETVFEKKPLETCASLGQLDAYMHDGFWKPMDTLREKQQLEKMWADSTAPWKIW